MHYTLSGDGRPFVFQHGLGSNLNQPQGMFQGMTGIQCISMDCPGHGEAPLPDGQQPGFDYYADQVLRLLDELGVQQAILGGISMGAGISTNIALRYPDRVQAIILIRPAWLDQGSPESLMILDTAAKAMQDGSGLEAFKALPAFQAIKGPLPAAAESVLGVFADTQRAELPRVLQAMVADHPFPSMAALANIKVPCLVIANENDPLHPYFMAEAMQAAIPGSRLEKVTSRYIDNTQHSIEVNQLIANFIQTI